MSADVPLATSLFDFALPPGHIAQAPARPRDAARLLLVDDQLADLQVRDLPRLLRPGDVLVANDTRVIPAQLQATRTRGGGGSAQVGITLDRPLPDGTWHALARNARRLAPGDTLRFEASPRPGDALPDSVPHGGVQCGGVPCGDALPTGAPPVGVLPDAALREDAPLGDARLPACSPGTPHPDAPLRATVVACDADGGVALRFDREGEAFASALEATGALALPPYIARPHGPTASDQADYQTVFARTPGAVAAPTAGLHFTPALLAALDAAGVIRATVTLHVGAGTFLPVREDDVARHRIHAERGRLDPATAAAINAARRAGGRVVAVGTTSLRLLESAAQPDGTLAAFEGDTSLFVLPGHRFRVVDGLLTNFHLPRSTLFMLVCALAGTARMQAAYAHAIAAGYRFYSYGDASLLWRA